MNRRPTSRSIALYVAGASIFLPGSVYPAHAAPGIDSDRLTVDFRSDEGPVNSFVWGVGAPDKYAWWAGNKALVSRIRGAGIRLVRVNPIQTLLYNNRDPYPAPGTWKFDSLDQILNTIFDAGAEPLFVIAGFPKGITYSKAPDGSIAEADWTEYARFMQGLVQRYNVRKALGPDRAVKYWEMWNEPTIEPDGKFGSKDAYMAFVQTVGSTMKRTDPAIKLVGPAYPWADFGKDGWLSFAAKNLAGQLDILSWHDYGPGPNHTDEAILDWTGENYEDDVRAIKSGGPDGIYNDPAGKSFGAAITEYNMSWQNGDDAYNRKYHSTLNTVFTASAIVRAINGKADMFCFYNLAETGKNHLGLLNNSDYSPYKPYAVFSLFGNHFGDRILSTMNGSADIETAASKRIRTGQVFVVIVNKSLDKTHDLKIQFAHMPGVATARIWKVDASDDGSMSSPIPFTGSELKYSIAPLTAVCIETQPAKATDRANRQLRQAGRNRTN